MPRSSRKAPADESPLIPVPEDCPESKRSRPKHSKSPGGKGNKQSTVEDHGRTDVKRPPVEKDVSKSVRRQKVRSSRRGDHDNRSRTSNSRKHRFERSRSRQRSKTRSKNGGRAPRSRDKHNRPYYATEYEVSRSVNHSRKRERRRSLPRRGSTERIRGNNIGYSRDTRWERRSRSPQRSLYSERRRRDYRNENPFMLAHDKLPVREEGLKKSFKFPTDPNGSFAKAMSSIACNAESQAKGVFSNISGGDNNFREELTQALALKLNFKTTQHANEKALLRLLKSKGSAENLKQAVQARGAIYGELLDPS